MTLTIHDDIEQGTEAWHDQRRGMVTASVVGQLVTLGPPDALTVECSDCNASAGRACISLSKKTATPIKTFHSGRKFRAEMRPDVLRAADNDTSRALTALLVAERITGHTDPTFMSDDMWRGVQSEPIARDIYSGHYQQAVEVGFMVRHEDNWTLGYSPDGLVADEGLVEIKSPRSKTHLKTILANEVPPQYMAQCQAGLLVSGRNWLDFVSYVGGMPLFVKRVHPDPRWQKAIVAACQQFETTATEMVATYRARVVGLPTTERVLEMEMSL